MDPIQLKQLFSEILEDKLKNIQDKIDTNTKHLDNVNVKLNNHIEHIIRDYSDMRKDVSSLQVNVDWLKEMKSDFQILREYIFTNRPQQKESDDKKQDANIEWNTWFTRVLITTSVSIITSIIVALIVMYFKK